MLRPFDDIDGLWPTLRRDHRLSGHQPLPGAVCEPAVRWRHRLAGPLFDGTLLPKQVGADLILPFGGCLHRFDALGSLIWKSRPLGIESLVGVEDLDGDRRFEILASNGKSLLVLDADSGALLWRMYLGPPTAGGFMHTAVRVYRDPRVGHGAQLAVGLLSSREVVLFDFSSGAERPRLRHRLKVPDFFHPSILVVDVDNDGFPELVVTKLSSIFVFDPHSGRMVAQKRWISGGTPKRNYGHFLAVDINGDGLPAFVTISDRVSRHIAVIENDGADLNVLWDRFVEHIYDDDRTELRAVAGSCCDIDRDGRVEIVVSMFGVDGDGRWWLEIIDAQSGEVRSRFPDWYLRGIDCGGGGAPTLFLSRERGRTPAAMGEIAVATYNPTDGLALRVLLPDARFIGRFGELRGDRTLFRTDLPPADDVCIVWADESPRVAVVTARDGLSLLAEDGTGQPIRTDMRCPQSIIVSGDMDGDGVIELVLGECDGSVWIVQPDGTVLAKLDAGIRFRPGSGPYYAAKPSPTPVVFAAGEKRYCAVPDAGGMIHLLEGGAPEPRVLWRIPGRGRIGPEEAYHSVTAAVLDDSPVVISASIGAPAIEARDISGALRRRWELGGLPSHVPTPNARTGVHEIVPLLLGGEGAIFVSGFAAWSMNSEWSSLIDVRSGSVLWERAGRSGGISAPGHILGFGPWNAASVDRSGPTTRLMFMAKDTVCEVDAQTGALLHEPWQLRHSNARAFSELGYRMDDFCAYGSFAVMDVDGDGVDEWVLIGNYGGHGVIDREHRVRWWRPAPLSLHTCAFAGLADVDGDGAPELGIGAADGDFVCLRASTGRELWRLHLGEMATGVISCDVDGDGSNEFIVSTAEGSLLAIGASDVGTGIVKWRMEFGYSLGPPVAADFDGSGRAQVLVVTGDGWLCGIS